MWDSKLPLWLNEGWADVYSSLAPKGDKALVGSPLPGHFQTLLTTKWLALDVLASVDHNSPLYNERNKAGIFYAESWLLVHMLYLSPGYRANFSKLLLAISSGQDMAQACQSVYGKGLKEIASDLDRYSRSKLFYGVVFDVKLEKAAEDPQVSDATGFDSGLVLADLLAQTRKRDEARQAYGQLAKDNPGHPEIDESLGYMELQAGDRDSARQYFSRAYAAGSKNPQMCFDYSLLEDSKGAIPILRRAVELKPDYVAAPITTGPDAGQSAELLRGSGSTSPGQEDQPRAGANLFSCLSLFGPSYGSSGPGAQGRRVSQAVGQDAGRIGAGGFAPAVLG